MFASLALATAAVVDGPGAGHWGWGFGFLFLLIPLFWIGLIVLFASLARRRFGRGGWGPGYAYGHHGHGGWGAAVAARSAESTLAERFAQGDIDEKEYRARLEVLRANSTFTPPTSK